MPTLFRLLTALAIIGAIIFAGIFSLATFVKPRQAQIEQEIQIKLPPVEPKPAATDPAAPTSEPAPEGATPAQGQPQGQQ